MTTTALRLLPSAELHTRSAPTHPRLQRGGPGCRVHSTAEVLTMLGNPSARRVRAAASDALLDLSAAIDARAAALGVSPMTRSGPTASDLAAARRAGFSVQVEQDPYAYDEPVTRAGAGRAHLARGTSAPCTEIGRAHV